MNEEYHQVYPSLTRGSKTVQVPVEINEPVKIIQQDGVFANHKTLILCVSIVVVILIVALVYMATKDNNTTKQVDATKSILKSSTPLKTKQTQVKSLNIGGNDTRQDKRNKDNNTKQDEEIEDDNTRQDGENNDDNARQGEENEDDNTIQGKENEDYNTKQDEDNKDDNTKQQSQDDDVDYEKEAAIIIEQINKQREAAKGPSKKEELLKEIIMLPKYLREAAKGYKDDNDIQVLTSEKVPMSALMVLKNDWNNEDFIRFMGTKKIKDKIMVIEEFK